MKKIFTTITAIALCSAGFSQTVSIDGVTYSIKKSDKCATITKCDNNSVPENLVVPSTVEYDGEQYPVTAVDGYSFWYVSNLKSVVFSESLEKIAASSFYGCDALSSVTFPSTLKTIESKSFSYCGGITEVFIPASVENFASGAFFYCDGIGKYEVDENNAVYTSQDGVVFTKDMTSLLFYPGNKILDTDTYVVPEGVTVIGDMAFNDSKIVNVDLPESLTTIGESAFIDCDFLSSVEISPNVSSIGLRCFSECNALEEIYVDSDNPVYKDRDGVLFSKDGTVLYCYPLGMSNSSYNVPSGVEEIAGYAFEHNEVLGSVTFPSSLKKIGDYALQWCTYLEKLNFKNTKLESIGLCAFTTCESLKEISFPETMKTISLGAFWTVYFDKLECWAVTPPSASGAFDESEATLYVRTGSKEAYEADADWGIFNVVETEYVGVEAEAQTERPYMAGDRLVVPEGCKAVMTVYGMDGRQMFEEKVSEDFVMPDMPAGVYVVRICADGNSYSVKYKRD